MRSRIPADVISFVNISEHHSGFSGQFTPDKFTSSSKLGDVVEGMIYSGLVICFHLFSRIENNSIKHYLTK